MIGDIDASYGNVLIFTDNEPSSHRIAEYIQTNAASTTKVATVDLTSESLKQDSFWESSHPKRIFFLIAILCATCFILNFVDIIFITASNVAISDEPLTSKFSSLANVLQLTQMVISHKFERPPRLWFVTKNATWVGGELNLLSSPIWGFGASVCLEHPELHCKRVDLDSDEACANSSSCFKRRI
jgi:hypothetical protein